jgi:hypothetical protein
MTKINEYKASNPINVAMNGKLDETLFLKLEENKIMVDIMEKEFYKFLKDN